MNLKRVSGGNLPAVFQFLFDLGVKIMEDKSETQTVLITLPTLRYASQFLGLGVLSALHQKGVFLDRTPPSELKVGQMVTWLNANKNELKCGTFLGMVNDGPQKGYFELTQAGSNARTFRQVEKFDEFCFAPYEGPSFIHDRKLSGNPQLIAEFFNGDVTGMTSQSRSELCLVGEPRLRSELLEKTFSIDGLRGCGDDLLRVEGLFDVRESPHFLSQFVKTMSTPTEITHSDYVIFDGAAAFQRHQSYMTAQTRFILLDRWEKGSEQVVTKLNSKRAKSKVTPIKLGKVKAPRGVELLAWSADGK